MIIRPYDRLRWSKASIIDLITVAHPGLELGEPHALSMIEPAPLAIANVFKAHKLGRLESHSSSVGVSYMISESTYDGKSIN